MLSTGVGIAMRSLLLGIGIMGGSMCVLGFSLTRGLDIGKDRKGGRGWEAGSWSAC